MKTLTILFVAAIMMGVGCSKSEDSENNPDKPDKPSPLPDLPDPNDVCSCMDDIIFMQYCYDNFDVNKKPLLLLKLILRVRRLKH